MIILIFFLENRVPESKDVYLIGIGSYLPEKVLTNAHFEKTVETTDEWITTRTGIKERRIAAVDEQTSDMGAKAALKAIEDSGINKEDIDLILVATTTPDYLVTSTAGIIQSKLGIENIPCFDVQAACSGFLYALSTAKAFVLSGLYKNVLVVATEKMSSFTDYEDRGTCILFGDGASACVVSKQKKGLKIGEVLLGADGCLHELIYIPAGGSKNPTTPKTVEERQHFFKMQGKEVFKHAVRRMNSIAEDCLAKSNLEHADIAWLVPHQANLRILTAMAKQFDIPESRVYKTVHKYGNTSASSVSIALDELVKNEKINHGDNFLLVAFGAGLTWGACILTHIEP
jgi:3-oxoacyl-[acyl-carrier-protein] synthase-3